MDTNINRESILANIEYYKKLIQEQETELSKTKMLLSVAFNQSNID